MEFAQKHAAKSLHPAHTSLDEFLKDPLLQAVIITSPDNLHAQHIIACAKAGKHILVEKPMVTNHEDGLQSIKICQENKVVLAVGFHLRWHTGHIKLHHLITQKNAIGRIHHIRVHWPFKSDASNWRSTPELGTWWSLAATGVHSLDLAHWFAKSEERHIVSQHSTLSREVYKKPHDETAIITLKYSDGLTVESTSSVLFHSPSRFEIYGSEGFAICEDTMNRKGAGNIWLNGEALDFTPASPFEGEIQNFISAIQGHELPEVTGESGLDIIDILIKIKY